VFTGKLYKTGGDQDAVTAFGQRAAETNASPGSGAKPSPGSTEPPIVPGSYSGETITVRSGGKDITGDALDIVSRVVQNEVGSGYHDEAIKAQAVAAYTYIQQNLSTGVVPTVYLAETVSDNVYSAVAEVMGQAVYFEGKLAFTPYHAISAGKTTSSQSVWGGAKSYLTAVDSSIDKQAASYKVAVRMSSGKVSELVYDKLGIETAGDPSGWFEILTYTDGDYNGDMAVCGETHSLKTGSKLTGRLLRESVLSLRSACFTAEYDSGTDTFIFVTRGFGHGVGMSQNGADLYAREGWSYQQILAHYYPGTELR